MSFRPWVPLLTGLILLLINPIHASAQSELAIGGAGIGLRPTDDGRILLERVAPNGPGARAGLQAGDWLVRVDDHWVTNLVGTQLVDAIRGPVGSKVTLVYVRGNSDPVVATVVRAALGTAPASTSGKQGLLPKFESAGTPRPAVAATVPAKGTTKFTRQTLKDSAANDVVAVTFLLPSGWQYQGRIVWLPEFSVLANLQLKLWETNTSTVVEWLPTQHFSYTDQLPGLIQPGANWMGAILAPPVEDPAAFVERFWVPQALSLLRGLSPVAREDYPVIARQTVARDAGWRAQSVRLRSRYERGGQPWERDVHFTLAYAPANNGVAMWNVQRAFSCSAPQGAGWTAPRRSSRPSLPTSTLLPNGWRPIPLSNACVVRDSSSRWPTPPRLAASSRPIGTRSSDWGNSSPRNA